jgi:chemotaxis protein CheZ
MGTHPLAGSQSNVHQSLKKVRAFIDSRKKDEPNFADVVRLAEIMSESFQAFFQTMDTTIYRELSTIADYISTMRHEIDVLQVSDIKEQRLPSAERELDAIVKSTEGATETIMAAAEAVLSAPSDDVEAYKAFVEEKMLAIFEACSFQDLTGQRISKVVETLGYIERRVARFASAMPEAPDLTSYELDAEEQAREQRKRDLILHGPAFDGEGIDQNFVDELFSTASKEQPSAA